MQNRQPETTALVLWYIAVLETDTVLTGNNAYKQIIIDAADTLAILFNPKGSEIDVPIIYADYYYLEQ